MKPVLFCAALSVLFQDAGPDKIGKDKAPVTARKVLAEIPKRKSAVIVELATFSTGPQKMEATYEGVLRKDVVAVKGTAEIYAKGAQMLVNTGARFDPPEALEGQEAAPALTFRNPALLLEDLNRVAAAASFVGDEEVDGRACKVLGFPADPAALRQALRDLGERMSKTVGRQFAAGGVQVLDFKTIWDERTSSAAYRVSVGKTDLRIYRVEFELAPKMKPGAIPGPNRFPDDLVQRWDVKFSKWDEEAPFEIPAPVKAKLGIK